MTVRAAHSAVYINDTDALYVFGGYDLNSVLGDLVVFRFNNSQWEDEEGKIISKFLYRLSKATAGISSGGLSKPTL